MNRVYCLYRVSDRGQVEKNDIPMQRIACRTFAQERGWEIEKELSEKSARLREVDRLIAEAEKNGQPNNEQSVDSEEEQEM